MLKVRRKAEKTRSLIHAHKNSNFESDPFEDSNVKYKNKSFENPKNENSTIGKYFINYSYISIYFIYL